MTSSHMMSPYVRPGGNHLERERQDNARKPTDRHTHTHSQTDTHTHRQTHTLTPPPPLTQAAGQTLCFHVFEEEEEEEEEEEPCCSQLVNPNSGLCLTGCVVGMRTTGRR